jgi:cytochrome b subunit of formate dehydrogenase
MTNRGILKYLIDCGLIITFILAFITGIVKFPELTPIFGNIFLLIPVSLLSKIHDYSGLVMGLLVLAHLLLNGRWIVAMTKSIFGRKKP